jgi:methyltransferase (TIGR00027 family)
MRPSAASSTAEYIALFRALESVRRPPESRLFVDPLAVRCLRPRFRALALAARVPAVLRHIETFVDWRWPGVRLAAQSRTRIIDDALKGAIAMGTTQLVILGAGYDTRAHRMSELAPCRVFEVDHPATLANKRQVASRWKRVTGTLRYVPTDFERDDLHARLHEHGFERDQPAFFVWEGVTNYLSEESVTRTLRFVAECAPASELIFTYVHRSALDGTHPSAGTRRLLRTLARAQEPWRFGFDPAALAGDLEKLGLDLVWERATLASRPECPAGCDHFRIALGRVPGRSGGPHGTFPAQSA